MLLAASATAVAGLAVTSHLDWLSFTLLILCFNSVFLIVFANSASLVIDPHKEIAGLASSIFGASTQLFGSLMMLVTLPLFKGAMVPWSIGLVIVSAIVLAGLTLYRPAVVAPVASRPGKAP